MRRWIWIAGAVLGVTGCMKEQPPPSHAAATLQRTRQQEQQMAARQQQLSRELSQQKQMSQQVQDELAQTKAQLEQYRAMQADEQAPAGREFTVKLDKPINASTYPGEAITAHLVSPILGSGGALVAAPGALLTARVIKVDQGEAPVVALSFENIETVNGEQVPIHATVNPQQMSRSFDAAKPDQANAEYDAALYPKGSAPKAIGGGPAQGGQSTKVRNKPKSRVVKVPAGAKVELVLTDPLARTAEPTDSSSTPNNSSPMGTGSSPRDTGSP